MINFNQVLKVSLLVIQKQIGFMLTVCRHKSLLFSCFCSFCSFLILYTINFYHLRQRMLQQKQKRSVGKQRISPSDSHPPASQRIKFNLSFDNLLPFVHTARTPPKPTTYPPLRSHRVRPASKTEESIDYQERLRMLSPDVVRDSSNVILRAIEMKGIGCVWDDVQEVRSEYGEERGEYNDQGWTASVWSDPPIQKNQSIASTNDQFSGYYAPVYQQSYQTYDYSQRYYDPNYFLIDATNIRNDERTTLMIKNIPNKYTIQSLAEEIDRQHANCYDFLYLPCDIKNNCNMGYGFINFINTQILQKFYVKFHNKRWSKFKSEKICNLTYARLQGLSSLIEHFQNSKVLNHKEKKYQPIIRQLRSIDELIQHQRASTQDPEYRE